MVNTFTGSDVRRGGIPALYSWAMRAPQQPGTILVEGSSGPKASVSPYLAAVGGLLPVASAAPPPDAAGVRCPAPQAGRCTLTLRGRAGACCWCCWACEEACCPVPPARIQVVVPSDQIYRR